MTMTELATHEPPLTASPSIAGDDARAEPAIDLAHLSQMTLGDRQLEREILILFDRQSDLLLARMREVGPTAIATFAHTLTGSARGVGAWRVAAAAEALERAVATTTNFVPALTQLAVAVGEARLAIDAMLRVKASA
jgi:HPt (histidine-containing phosphotransfer) domain-containing protein